MKSLVCSVFALLGLASPTHAADYGYALHSFPPTVAIAVPLVIEDPYGAYVFAAPLVQPVFVVPPPVFVTPYRHVVPVRSYRRCR